MAIVRMEQLDTNHFSSTFHAKAEDGKRRSTARTYVSTWRRLLLYQGQIRGACDSFTYIYSVIFFVDNLHTSSSSTIQINVVGRAPTSIASKSSHHPGGRSHRQKIFHRTCNLTKRQRCISKLTYTYLPIKNNRFSNFQDLIPTAWQARGGFTCLFTPFY